MSATPTDVYLPPSFPYPILISSIDAPPSTTVSRGTRLLSYSYQYQPLLKPPETRFGTWDSSIDGEITRWRLKAGDVVKAAQAALVIQEPCKHGVQHGGLCVLCGRDMTNVDYLGFSDTSRASIQMTHEANGPTVSLEEAQRIERETALHLLQTRRLSLIVDLDQTMVHATVDPTVGEWIAEGKAWEEKHESGGECSNPNWDALKDVKEFKLGPEGGGGDGGCMYYIKPRPGWDTFLRDMALKYEMHVYTMGTRAYAEKVCAAIDPDGSLFGGRLLSRDESGSLTQKSLQRLFPCDTSMVVIIDDRGDVWEWSPNLIKVVPYDFFVGIGDINSAFLPKQLSAAPPPESKSKAMMAKENSIALEAQVEERPLAKAQEQLADEPEEVEVKEEEIPHPHHKKALLKSEDAELERVRKILDEVHLRYFDAYDNKKRRRDVTTIIPSIRSEALAGVHIVFSSMYPLDIRPESTDVWKMAVAFGARCSSELVDGVTHVVAAKKGTDKVNLALRRAGVFVVWAQWLTECVNVWKRVDETPYLMEGAPMGDVLRQGVVPKHAHAHKEGGEPPALMMGEIDWNDINDEVEAAMNESEDDEAEVDVDEGRRKLWTDEDESAPNTPRGKRSRSVDSTSSPEMKRRKVDDDAGDEEEEDDDEEDFLAKELGEEWG